VLISGVFYHLFPPPSSVTLFYSFVTIPAGILPSQGGILNSLNQEEMNRMSKHVPLRILAALAVTVSLVFLAAAAAAGGSQEAAVSLNGFALNLEHPALAENGVTLVPAEEFCQTVAGPVPIRMDDSSPLPGGVSTCWAEDGSPVLTVTYGESSLSLRPGEDGARWIDGVLYAPLRPLAAVLGLGVAWDGSVQLTMEQTQVGVDSLEGLFQAITPRTEIILAPGTYSFADLDLSKIDNPYLYPVFDVDGRDDGDREAYDMVAHSLCALRITSQGATISTPWAYSDVLKFENCRWLELEGLTLVHDVEPGHCSGDCLQLDNCSGVRITNCTLNGSGAYGLATHDSTDIFLTNSRVEHCTYGAFSLVDSARITVQDCGIRSCTGFELLAAMGCRDILFDRCTVEDNTLDALASCHSDSRNICFQECAFQNNWFGSLNSYGWQASGGAAFWDCTGLEAGAA
jgi:hypothetical protein